MPPDPTPADPKTPFCRYQHGNCYRVPANMREILRELHTGLDDWSSLQKLLVTIKAARRLEFIHGKPVRDTWKLAFLELIEHLNRSIKAVQFVPLLKQTLGTILEHDQISQCWDEIRDTIVEEVDAVSGWKAHVEKSLRHGSLDNSPDGGHSLMIGEQRFGVTGLETNSEERLAFIAGNALRKYGEINAFIMLLGLVAINDEFNTRPSGFPPTVKCEMPEGDHETWFLHWIWRINNIGVPVRTFWRPRSCYCDPEWLASDLVARVAEEVPEVPRRSSAIINPLRFQVAFKDFPYQFDVGVRTVLLFGDETEVYFSIDGLPVRWINGTQFDYPVMTVGCKQRDCEDGTRVARRFMDVLAFEARIPVNEGIRGANYRRYLPYCVEPKSTGGLRLPAESIVAKVEMMEPYTEKEQAAMSFFRQGTNAEDAHSGYLSYYKVIEQMDPGNERTHREWINGNIDSVLVGLDPKWKNEVIHSNSKAGNYLYKCRLKSAHAQSDKGKLTHVYSLEEEIIMTRNLPIVRALARKIIDEHVLR